MENEKIAENILKLVDKRTQEYLEEIGISVESSNSYEVDNKEELNSNSVIVGIIGDIDVSFVISYNDNLLNKITKQFLDGTSNEDQEITESLAMEFANIVIGNGLSQLERTRSLYITTPLLIEKAKHLSSSKDSIIFASKIKTEYGNILLQCIYLHKSREDMKKVLIVDDSLIMRKKLFNYIEDLGYNIVGTACDGESAIELAKKFQPDIITMDITMPRVNGIEAIKEIRKSNHKVKIIMITSSGQESNILHSISAGASSYLVKPIDKDKLEKTMKDVIQGT